MNYYGKKGTDEHPIFTGICTPETLYFYYPSGSYVNDLVVAHNTNIEMEVIRPAWIVCDHCGIRNPDDSKTFYCVACGAPLPEDQFLVRRYNG